MAELADALASGASVREDVQVQVLFRAHKKPPSDRGFFIFLFLKPSSILSEIIACNQIVTTSSVKKWDAPKKQKGKACNSIQIDRLHLCE